MIIDNSKRLDELNVFAKNFAQSVGMDTEVNVLDIIKENYLGLYIHSTKEIQLSVLAMQEEWSKHKENISFEEFLIVILCHELGHSIDQNNDARELLQRLELDKYFVEALELKNVDYYNSVIKGIIEHKKESELAAWHNGRTFVPVALLDFYDKYNEMSLNRYVEMFTKLSEDTWRDIQ